MMRKDPSSEDDLVSQTDILTSVASWAVICQFEGQDQMMVLYLTTWLLPSSHYIPLTGSYGQLYQSPSQTVFLPGRLQLQIHVLALLYPSLASLRM